MNDSSSIQLVFHSRLPKDVHVEVEGACASLIARRQSTVVPVPCRHVVKRKLELRISEGGSSDAYTIRVLRSRLQRRNRPSIASSCKSAEETRPLILPTEGNEPRSWSSTASSRSQALRLTYSRIEPNEPRLHIIIFTDRDTSAWLSNLSDSCSLSSLCLPGSHETLARYGWPFSQCQDVGSTVGQQLREGLRFMDIRLRPRGEKGRERLLAYHGSVDERIEFSAVLEQIWAFLDGPGRSETLIMSIKQEGGDQDTFIKLLKTAYIDASPPPVYDGFSEDAPRGRQRWFLENRIPTLGEVRGKIVLFSRFVIDAKYDFPGGISPPIWPDSFEGCFDYELPSGHKVLTQDWYKIGSLSSVPRKFELICDLMDQGGRDASTFALDFCNGSSVPWALPQNVAKGWFDSGSLLRRCSTLLATRGVNPRLRDRVADVLAAASARSSSEDDEKQQEHALEGLMVCFAIDFYTEPAASSDLVPLLIEANFV